jgi:hypothetical protein
VVFLVVILVLKRFPQAFGVVVLHHPRAGLSPTEGEAVEGDEVPSLFLAAGKDVAVKIGLGGGEVNGKALLGLHGIEGEGQGMGGLKASSCDTTEVQTLSQNAKALGRGRKVAGTEVKLLAEEAGNTVGTLLGHVF